MSENDFTVAELFEEVMADDSWEEDPEMRGMYVLAIQINLSLI